MQILSRLSITLPLLAGLSVASYGQAPAPPPVPAAQERPQAVYLLAPKDSLVIRALNVEEINEKSFQIDAEGYLNLPIVGRLRAAGLTVEQLEAAITDRLKAFLR